MKIPDELLDLSFEDLVVEIGENKKTKTYYVIKIETSDKIKISQEDYKKVGQFWEEKKSVLLINNEIKENPDNTEWND